MQVRPAQPADADQVARVHIRTWQAAYAGIVPDSVLAALDDELPTRAERMRQRWSSPQPGRFRTVVCVAGEVPIGFATFGPYRLDDGNQPEVDDRVGEVLAIYVDPAQQGRGAGRALMDAAVADLGAGGCREVRLWVLTDNAPSRRFYEKYGFAPDGHRHFFRVEPPDGPPVDLPEVRYALALPASSLTEPSHDNTPIR